MRFADRFGPRYNGRLCSLYHMRASGNTVSLPEPVCGLLMRKDFESRIYRKSRVAARLILKARSGRGLSPRQRRLADALSKDTGVTPRLIQQGINQLCRKH
jgi:hypothetical protein